MRQANLIVADQPDAAIPLVRICEGVMGNRDPYSDLPARQEDTGAMDEERDQVVLRRPKHGWRRNRC